MQEANRSTSFQKLASLICLAVMQSLVGQIALVSLLPKAKQSGQ